MAHGGPAAPLRRTKTMPVSLTNPLDQVQASMIGYFGRAGDPGGVNYWVGQLNGGYQYKDMAASFSVQPEAKAQYPFLANPNIGDVGAFVDQVYQNLFNRDADVSGK